MTGVVVGAFAVLLSVRILYLLWQCFNRLGRFPDVMIAGVEFGQQFQRAFWLVLIVASVYVHLDHGPRIAVVADPVEFDEALSEHTEPEWFDSTWVGLYTYKIREQHDPPGQITRTTTHKLVLPIFFFVVSFLYRRFVVKRWRG
ncbi:MAG: hypothetical protein QGH20_01900 [Candidatus Latescibacteria bacterium]|jgi:hypothetical protein|nr:hypothetical protein [Candidatus Latescibacterota bacterium]